jgi:hypothetical protein
VRPPIPSPARLLGLAAALLAALPAAAQQAPEDAPPPGGLADLAGPRALALSAAVGSASGNDGLFVNPGAIAARRRYAADGSVFLERRGSSWATQVVGGSVVDAITSPIAAGFSYQRAQEGDYTGNVFHLAFAGPVVDRFFLGVSGKWLSLKGPALPEGGDDDVRAATVDAGFLFQVSPVLSIGAAGYNLVPIGHEAVAPAGAGAGIDVGNEQKFHVTADWRTDLDRRGEGTNRYSAGAELLLGGLMPLRGGWSYDETLDTQWWSVGGGLVTRDVAIDVGFRQSVETPSARTFSAALRFFAFD